MAATDGTERNRAQQRQWYGEPVGDTVHRLVAALRVSQRELAELIGLSAPMLSQLASGHRAKIANPSVLHRLQQLLALADDPATEQLAPAALKLRLDQVRAASPQPGLTAASTQVVSGAVAVQGLLRALASAAELADAAAELQHSHPQLAELLRVYGTGRTAEAREHYSTWMS